jgi:prepilin-type N-terminal cleavage/methylation domain-containing protein
MIGLKKLVLGFTLIEMSIVLVIIGFILGSFLTLTSAQMEQMKLKKANDDLLSIKEALMGYVVTNGVFPCPDANQDGVADLCSSTLNTSATEGGLPWSTLAVPAKDPWGRYYQYRINNAFTIPFMLSTVGSGAGLIRICKDSNCTGIEASNVPLVVYSKGRNAAIYPASNPDELENSDLDSTFVSRDFTENGFDDLLIWISSNVLMNRMVSVGKLP